jgi:hypothetical protein
LRRNGLEHSLRTTHPTILSLLTGDQRQHLGIEHDEAVITVIVQLRQNCSPTLSAMAPNVDKQVLRQIGDIFHELSSPVDGLITIRYQLGNIKTESTEGVPTELVEQVLVQFRTTATHLLAGLAQAFEDFPRIDTLRRLMREAMVVGLQSKMKDGYRDLAYVNWRTRTFCREHGDEAPAAREMLAFQREQLRSAPRQVRDLVSAIQRSFIGDRSLEDYELREDELEIALGIDEHSPFHDIIDQVVTLAAQQLVLEERRNAFQNALADQIDYLNEVFADELEIEIKAEPFVADPIEGDDSADEPVEAEPVLAADATASDIAPAPAVPSESTAEA